MRMPWEYRATWRTSWPEVLEGYAAMAFGESPTVLSACPPCQGMSSARAGRGPEIDPSAGSRDDRNLLVEVVAKVATQLRPRVIVVENVPAFLSRLVHDPRSGRPTSAANLLQDLLESQYKCYPFLTDLADYKVPQRRVRAFMTFLRHDEDALRLLTLENRTPYPQPEVSAEDGGWVSLREALRELNAPKLDAIHRATARDGTSPMHSVPVWGNNHRYRMVAAIPPGSGGRAWETSHCIAKCNVHVGQDDATCPSCDQPLLRTVVQKADGSYRLVHGFRRSSYSRMPPDDFRPHDHNGKRSHRVGLYNSPFREPRS